MHWWLSCLVFAFLHWMSIRTWDWHIVFLTTRCHTFKPYLYYEKYHQWNLVVYKELKISSYWNFDWKGSECPIWYLDEDKFGLEYNKTCIKSGFKCPMINKTIAINNICDGFLYIPSYGAGINGNDCGDWSDETFCHGRKWGLNLNQLSIHCIIH